MVNQWSGLDKYENETSLNADTLNKPIIQLGDRTQYLYDHLNKLMDGDSLSAVILTNVDLSTENGKAPSEGDVVYLDGDKFSVAKATMSLYDDYTAADSAFTVGILKSDRGAKGDVLVYGRMSLDNTKVASLLEDGEEFRQGRYYLSANEAGKLTATPNGPLVYVCSISGSVGADDQINGFAVVNPQFLDLGTSHVHRSAVLTPRPAGYESVDGYYSNLGNDAKKYPFLRFGGTWTSDNKVNYDFYLRQKSVNWTSKGIELCWKENGASTVHSVYVHAPDEEVEISNGLTARLSLPTSSDASAYDYGKAEGIGDTISWPTLTFPDAGRGWLKHKPSAVASKTLEDGSEVRVMVRGKLDVAYGQIGVAFPEKFRRIPFVSTPEESKAFAYSGVTYRFTKDVSSVTDLSKVEPNGVTEVNVAIGTDAASSAHYLAEALTRSLKGKGTFLTSSYVLNGETYPELLILDGSTGVKYTGSWTDYKTFYSEESANTANFNAVGASGVKAVVFDVSNLNVVSSPDIVEGIDSHSWTEAGNLELMLYGVGSADEVIVPVETIAYGTWIDDEPDAKYDYVIGLDATVAKYWPPIPPKSAALIVNGVEMDNKALAPDTPTVSFGKDTIHWFCDDDGRRPWPDAFKSRNEEIKASEDKTEVMHWIRGFQCASGPVTSIQVKEGSPLKVYGYGTYDAANTGDLEIAADFDFKIVDGGAPGHLVPKSVSDGTLVAGPVVERVIGGSGVSVISQAGCPDGQGTVVISLDNGAYRSQFTDIALENAEQAKIGMFPYIRLKGYTTSITSPSAFTATMRVPTNLPDGKYALMVSANVFGEVGFSGTSVQHACVKFGYNILPDFSATGSMKYSNLKTTLLKPDQERTVLIPFGHGSSSGTSLTEYNGFDPVHVTTEDDSMTDINDVVSNAFGKSIPDDSDFSLQTGVVPELRPGYLVGIRISRTVMQDESKTAYKSALGFINLSWTLVSTEGYGVKTVEKTGDMYALDTSTGLYHKVVAVADSDTSEITLGVDQSGVAR